MNSEWPFFRVIQRLGFGPSSLMGISLEPSEVVVCSFRRRGKQTNFISNVRIPIPASVFRTNPLAAARELAAQLRNARIRPGRCIVCIPLSWVFTAELDMPKLSESDVESLVRMEAERRFPLAPDDLALALSHREATGSGQRALLTGVPADFLANVETALRGARLRPVSVTIGLAALVAEETAAHTLLLCVGKGYTDVAIVSEGRPPILRNLMWLDGSSSDMDASDVHGMVRQLRITLAQLPAERRESVKSALVCADAEVPTDVRELLAHSLAEQGMELDAETPRNLQTAQGCPGLIAATARALSGAAPALELTPPKRNERKWSLGARFPARSARWGAGLAVGAVLLVIGAFLFQSQQLAGLEDQWSTLGPRFGTAKALQDRVKKYRSWYDNTIPSLEIPKFLAAAFPADGSVWLKSLRVKERTTATCTGNAASRDEWMRVMEELGKNKELEDLQIVQARGDAPFSFTLTFRWKGKDAGGP